MENKKITKEEMFNIWLNSIADDFSVTLQKKNNNIIEVNAEDMRQFITHEIELLEKRKSADKKPTLKQIANNGIMEAIYQGMELNRYYTVTEIMKEIPECGELSNQHVTRLVTQMTENGRLERIVEKRKALFRVLREEVVEE